MFVINEKQLRIPENTEYTDVSTKLDPILDDRLKGVYVTSKGMVNKTICQGSYQSIHLFRFIYLQTESIKNIKPMPQKGPTVTHALGYKDCDNVGPGRLSLLQAMKILTDRQSNPAIWPVTKIAEVNNIQVEHARMLLLYRDSVYRYESFEPYLLNCFLFLNRGYYQLLPSFQCSVQG